MLESASDKFETRLPFSLFFFVFIFSVFFFFSPKRSPLFSN